jgi:hypothetical protein
MIPCPLCQASTAQQLEVASQFYDCPSCGTVFRHPQFFISSEKEKARYLLHENDVTNDHYRAFVSPIVTAVCNDFTPPGPGLDFGAGTGPVISEMLRNQGYKMNLWDPFFHPEASVLEHKYKFIVCCEVIEHFHEPFVEFQRMKNLLLPSGKLYCKTALLPKKKAFANWYYKNDPTHVIFYSEKNLKWIQRQVGYTDVSVGEQLIIFDA